MELGLELWGLIFYGQKGSMKDGCIMSKNSTVECYRMFMVECYEVECLMWLTRAWVISLLYTNLSSSFPLPLTHSSLLSILSMCWVYWHPSPLYELIFLPGVLFYWNSYMWLVIVICLGITFSDQSTEAFKCFLTTLPCFIFIMVLLLNDNISTISYLFNIHLFFFC